MDSLYNFLAQLAWWLLGIAAHFSPQLKLFVEGRKESEKKIASFDKGGRKLVWFHAASLGEFEQGRPLMEGLKAEQPELFLLLTFFSPSGYEVSKDWTGADLILYLPFDTKKKCNFFIEKVSPDLAVFVKYEFWPNLLEVLKNKSVPTVLISANFRPDQLFFKKPWSWMRDKLKAFHYFFVQNQRSKALLSSIGIDRAEVTGDTRFDRVYAIREEEIQIDFMEYLSKGKQVVIAGSTWPSDHKLLEKVIPEIQDPKRLFVIAPHKMNASEINRLQAQLGPGCALLSEGAPKENTSTLIVDRIGLLSKLFAYADLSYIGGGFDKEGVHNVLEPAVFGIPVLIGPVFQKFEEAVDMVESHGAIVVKDEKELKDKTVELLTNEGLRKNLGNLNLAYVKGKLGATERIQAFLLKSLKEYS